MRKVTAPDGREWKVGRQWFPKHPRIRRRDRDRSDSADAGGDGGWLDSLDFGLDDAGAGILIGLALVAVAFVAVVVIFPIVALTLELLLLVVLFVAGLVGRIVFRRPWHVLARSDAQELRFEVKGFRASGRRVKEVAAALESGRDPAQLNPAPG